MAAVATRYLATGNVNPAVVVCPDTTKNFHVKAAPGAGACTTNAAILANKPEGISQEGTWYPPGVLGSDGFAAHDGQPLTVFGEGEECLLTVNSSTGITAGDDLTFDSSGNAVTIAYTYDAAYTANVGIWKVAKALETANASEKARVMVQIQFLPELTA